MENNKDTYWAFWGGYDGTSSSYEKCLKDEELMKKWNEGRKYRQEVAAAVGKLRSTQSC